MCVRIGSVSTPSCLAAEAEFVTWSQMTLYLDNAATTRMRPSSLEALQRTYAEAWGNPSGAHRSAQAAKARLEEARECFAVGVGASPREVTFTSGATEAVNTVVRGVARHGGDLLLASAIEHHCVLEPISSSTSPSSLVPVGRDGLIDLVALEGVLVAEGERVRLVALMAVNNEVGTVQPVAEAAALLRRLAPEAILLCDAVQGASWIDLSVLWPSVDALTISAHKFGGPKGTGVLLCKEGMAIEPLLRGGGQESDRRSGTQNVAGAVAAAAAFTEAMQDRDALWERASAFTEGFLGALLDAELGIVVNGDRGHSVPGILNLSFEGATAEEVLFLCDRRGLELSAGSSCASGAIEPSHVLVGMGISVASARSSVRVSFGWDTPPTIAETAASELIDVLRSLGVGR